MTDGWLDNLPDLWPGYPKKRGRGRSTPAEFYFPKFIDYPAVRRKLFNAFRNDGTRQKWEELITRIFQENKNYDEQWANNPNNPFWMEWLKNDLPHAIRKRQFDKLSPGNYSRWRRIVLDRFDLFDLQGSEKCVEIFDKKQEQYLKGHRYFYLWTPDISRLAKDENLICTILGLYHDHVSEIVEKIVSDEIRFIHPDMYARLVNFTGCLNQVELENLVMLAEDKGMLEPVSKPAKPVAGSGEADLKSKDETDEPYIPFTKAIEFSGGILTRKKLEKAIRDKKVRCNKPSSNRLNVHIQDVIQLIKELSENMKITEEASRMFSEWKNQFQKKISNQVNLD